MTAHTPMTCKPGCLGCHLCDGGLVLCTVCGCAEGSLPTHCPGHTVHNEQQEQIFMGKLDFKDGQWIENNG